MKILQCHSSHIDLLYQKEIEIFEFYLRDAKEDIIADVKKGCYYGLFDNNILLGYCCIHEDREEIYLNNLVVSQQYKGLGYSKTLIQFIKQYAYLQEVKKIWLHVSIKNDIALGLYNKCGFKIKETVKDFYNFNEDALLMEYVN